MRGAQMLGLSHPYGAPLVQFPYLVFGCTKTQAAGPF
jgi:hypothetical protein